MSKKYTDDIIAIEFDLFDKVQNEGGRASCQDDFRTFNIMRGAQFDAWTDEMRESYLDDLKTAMAAGRNLVMEKYAYMTGYAYMGERDDIERKQELLMEIMVPMEEDTVAMHQSYPNIARHSRPLGMNTGRATSVDKYLFCELMTYSARTLDLMNEYIKQLRAEGKSLPLMILENTATRYGFSSLDDAEARIR